MAMRGSKDLEFVFWSKPGKTSIYNVVSKNKQSILGEIKWFGRWRQYCFYPSPNCVFNYGCLQDIQDFIVELMEERRRVKR